MRLCSAGRSAVSVMAVAALLVPTVVRAAAPEADLPLSWSAAASKAGPETFGVEIESDVPFQVSDGVVLRASIVHPVDLASGKRAKGSFPVLLEQTPYGFVPAQQGWGLDGIKKISQYFVSRGYIYVFAEVRGTHHSGGKFGLISEREKQDGAELVEWVAHHLEGSNGSVGLTGCSYTGLNQYFTAALVGKDSPVKAMAPTAVGPDWYREPSLVGGVPNSSMERAIIDAFATTGTESAVRFSFDTAADIKAGGELAYDRSFWQSRAAANVIPRIVENGIPALIVADWNDYPTSPSEAYAMFQNAASGRDPWAPMRADQKVSPRYQLIVGNEQHCAGRGGGRLDIALLTWFDTWLKDADTGIQRSENTMHLRELGSDRWIGARVYPQVGRYKTYYLRADGALSTDRPGKGGDSDHLVYAVPNSPGATLTYSTQPFAEAMVLEGPLEATIYAKSSKANIVLIADLFDVAPDGRATQLSMGALIGSMRALVETRSWRDGEGRLIRPYHPSEVDEPLTSGAVVELNLQLQPRQVSLGIGHRLRLVVKSQSDFAPCNELFPGKRAFWCVDPTVPQRQTLEGATFEVQRNAQWPSYLNVPLLAQPPRE